MNIRLFRYDSRKEDTKGSLYVNGLLECLTLEDEFRAVKVPGETRIPEGTYEIGLNTGGGMNKAYKKRFPDIHIGMLELLNVPGFTNIYIHILNTEDETDGCIGVGKKIEILQDGRSFLKESTTTYLKLYLKIIEAIELGEKVTIEITEIDLLNKNINEVRLVDNLSELIEKGFETVPVPGPTDPNDFNIPLHKRISRFFRNTKAGKVITTGAVTGVALLTGINLNDLIPHNNMEYLQAIPLDLIVEYGLYVLVLLIGLFIKKPGTQKFIEDKIEAAAPAIVASVDEKSDGGKRITPGEVKDILSAIFKK
ncbi:MAG: DUF5675 family protein [Balneola sp.]